MLIVIFIIYWWCVHYLYLVLLALNHLWSSGIRDPHNWSDHKETPSWLVRGHVTMTTAHSAGSVPGHVYHHCLVLMVRVRISPTGTIDRLLKGERIDGKGLNGVRIRESVYTKSVAV